MREWLASNKRLVIKLVILVCAVGIAIYINKDVGLTLARALIMGF